MKKRKQITNKELKELRDKYLSNETYCPVLFIKLTKDNINIDHIHRRQYSIYDSEVVGLIRSPLHKHINMMLGKIENMYVMFPKEIRDNYKLSDILRRIANYIDYYSDINNYEELLIHPKEKIKEIPIGKQLFNRFNKWCKEKYNKTFKYPKKGKILKSFEKYLMKFLKDN